MKVSKLASVVGMIVLGIALRAGAQANSGWLNVRDLGAAGDGTTKDTAAIAKAIETTSSRGGGTIFFPAGVYLTGPIHLKSNITLNIDAGATVKFSTDFADFMPLVEGRYEGIMVNSFSPLIYAKDAENIAIVGRGKLDGQGQTWWPYANGKPPEGPWLEAFAKANADRTDPIAKRPFLRPPFFQPQGCKGVLVEGVTFTNSPFWTITPIFCDDVKVRGVTVLNPHSPNTDGINPDSCSNVHISDCHISVGDDCITIKSGRDEEGRKIGKPAENYVIENCTMLAGHGGVTIGSEMSGGVKNITITNCVFDGTDRGIRIKSTRGRGGVIENVRVSNIVMRNIKEQAIHITTRYSKSDPEAVSERTPIFRDFHFSGLTGDAAIACEVVGLEEQWVEGLTFSDIQLKSKTGFTLQYARDIEIRDVRLTVEKGPLVEGANVDDVKVVGLSTRHLLSTAATIWGKVQNVVVEKCSVPEGTKAIVQVEKSSSGEVTSEGNKAGKKVLEGVEEK